MLLMPTVKQGSAEYMGVNMDAVHMLLEFVEKKIDSVRQLFSETADLGSVGGSSTQFKQWLVSKCWSSRDIS